MTKLWSISNERLEPQVAERLNSEDRLEAWLEADIGLLADDLLLIGRQVTTAHGGRVDLLAINADGALSRDAEEMAEYVVPVEWLKTFEVSDAKTFPGAFASQHVVCKLSDPATLSFLERAFA